MQKQTERGITVNVPKGWSRSEGASYVDFTDPRDAERKVRLLKEASTSTSAQKFLTAGPESGQKSNRFSNCPSPYNRVDLKDVSIGGKPGAVLEYTCGGEAWHVMWGAIVENGSAYEFYVRSVGSRWAETKPIFDEMVNSFSVATAG
jgi:hypothetical protein